MPKQPDNLNAAALVGKVRAFYVENKGGPAATTQQEIADDLGISFAYLNRLFQHLDRGEPLPKIRGNNLKVFDAFVRRRRL